MNGYLLIWKFRFTSVPSGKSRWICAGMGLLTIPVIFQPIDSAVHYTLEHTYRPFSAAYLCPPIERK